MIWYTFIGLWRNSFRGKIILRIGWHLMNGSPVIRGGQLQIGLWLTTSHLAPTPQDPAQGFMHFWLLHASDRPQSELTTHSGRQAGGEPLYDGKHEQTDWPLIGLHWLYGPHGDGWHGVGSTGAENEGGIDYLRPRKKYRSYSIDI